MSTETTNGDTSLMGVQNRPDRWRIVKKNDSQPLRISLYRHRGGQRKAHRRAVRELVSRLINFSRTTGSSYLSAAEVAFVFNSATSQAICHNDAGVQLHVPEADSTPTASTWPSDDTILFSTFNAFRDLLTSFSPEDRALLRLRRRLLQKRRAAQDSRARRQQRPSSLMPQPLQPQPTDQLPQQATPEYVSPIIIKPEHNEDVMIDLFRTYFPSA